MKQSFTLIELMVSIAIIMIVVSLFQPAIAKALNQTKNVGCKSHLRQLGISTTIYLDNHKNLLPHEDAGSTNPPFNKAWYQVLGISWHERGIPLTKGFNLKMNDRLEDYGTPSSPLFRNMQTILFPSKTPYLFDSRHSLHTAKGIYSSVSGHHSGYANFLMLDMHVQNIYTSPTSWQKESPLYWDPDQSLDNQSL